MTYKTFQIRWHVKIHGIGACYLIGPLVVVGMQLAVASEDH